MQLSTTHVAAITGAGSGIGRATALAFAAKGCRIAAIDVDEAAARETVRLVAERGGRATAHQADVRDLGQVEAAAAEVVEAHGACNIIVNNAGVTSAGSFEAEPMDDLRWLVDINVWGVVHGCRAFLPHLRAAGQGHIVNLSSMVGLVGLPHNVAYSMSKGAVRSFSEGLRSELIRSSIGLTVVFPGSINTNITAAARGAEAERLARLGRSRLAPLVLRKPSAVADAIVRGVERDRARMVVGPDAHVVSAISRILPGRSGLVGRATSRIAR